MSKGFTVFLGTAEVLGSLGIAFGVLTQIAALGLILLMLGAIHRKIFVWQTGFWGEKASGWHYDLTFLVMNLVIHQRWTLDTLEMRFQQGNVSRLAA
jgi:putative oxidoreductase